MYAFHSSTLFSFNTDSKAVMYLGVVKRLKNLHFKSYLREVIPVIDGVSFANQQPSSGCKTFFDLLQHGQTLF
jgi:hypothetical protein